MAPATEAESSEDVNDFLLRIRELGDKRDKEDEERTRKLEEEILKGRKERQARRAGELPKTPRLKALHLQRENKKTYAVMMDLEIK